MKRFITVLMLVLAVAAAMPVLAQERVDSKIRFNDLYGEVSIRPDAEEDDAYEIAELDTIIYEDDRIRTKEESGAILGLEDMSTFVIKPESILIIHSEEENETKMEMLAGRIIGNVKKMAEGKTMGFEMSQCVAGIKGTNFVLTSSNNGEENRIEVIRGQIEVTAKATGAVYNVDAGNCLVINKKEVSKTEIDIEKLKTQFQSDYEKMNEKLTIDELMEKLKDKSSSIKNSLDSFKEKSKSIKEKLDAGYNDEIFEEFQTFKTEVTRFAGEIDESNSVIAVAKNRLVTHEAGGIDKKENNRSELDPRSNTLFDEKLMSDAIDSLSQQCNDYQTFLKEVESLELTINKKRLEKKNISPDSSYNSETAATLREKIGSIGSEVNEIINDNPDNSSYDSFREAANKCREYLEDLPELYSSITDFANDGGSQTDVNKLKSEYDSTYKKVQDAITRFSSVPEITNDVIKNMNDIEKLIPDYASKVREYLAEYNAIDKSSVDAKKRYVTAVSKLLVSYDRTKRQYTKANRMYQQTVKDFKKSNFKTSEYNEVAEAWDRIESAMTELDSESEELSSCVDALKSQLDDMLGQ